jgi:DNA-directed RNA polymerase specialized sigma24 family protein
VKIAWLWRVRGRAADRRDGRRHWTWWAWRVARRRRREATDRREVEGVTWHDELTQSELDSMAALAKLTDRQRAAVVLHLGVGFSLREVAAILGSTVGLLKMRLHLARLHLRLVLADTGLGLEEGLQRIRVLVAGSAPDLWPEVWRRVAAERGWG